MLCGAAVTSPSVRVYLILRLGGCIHIDLFGKLKLYANKKRGRLKILPEG